MNSRIEGGENKLDQHSISTAIERIKKEVRKWYGSLSVKEIICNKVLIEEIEKFERMLGQQAVLR